MKEPVARVEPAQRWQDRQGAAAKLSVSRRKKFAHWGNSVRADESVDLDPERNERDQENQTDRAKKPASRRKISRRANVIAPKKSRNRRCEPAIRSDDFVKAFRDRRETRNVVVIPGQPLFRRSTS